MKHTQTFEVLRCKKEDCTPRTLELIGEEPLRVRIDDNPYAVIMRTPGEEKAHAAGTCLAEGLIDGPGDIRSMGYDPDLEPNEIDIWLTDERRHRIPDLLERKSFVSQTSCGICGKQMIKDLNQILKPAVNGMCVPVGRIFDCAAMLNKKQHYYPITRGSHAALIFDTRLDVISFAEDVGRHNALDKAVGKLLLDGDLDRAGLLVMSSRISYELVQKAARAKIAMIISKSRPTALAVEMARSLNMTLACAFGEGNLLAVCGRHRIIT